MAVTVRTVSCSVTFNGNLLTDVLEARGEISADGGWPSCSVFLTAKPTSGNEEDDLIVDAGAGNNTRRFTGKVRRFRPSAFPKGIEMAAVGTLAYAAEWSPADDILFDEVFPSGATDQDIIKHALDQVPQISYTGSEIDGTSTVMGTEAEDAFVWKAGTSAWNRIQAIDRATLYRTYQTRDGSIKRVLMIGHPNSSQDFTLAELDVLEGTTGDRDTERTRNAVLVFGYDYGYGDGPALGVAYGSNSFQGDGSNPNTRYPEKFSSEYYETGLDPDGNALGFAGLDADAFAAQLLPDVNKEFVEADVQSWRDDTHGPGMTCLLDLLVRMAIGEKLWVQRYAWRVSDGWYSQYGLSGGGIQSSYSTPEV